MQSKKRSSELDVDVLDIQEVVGRSRGSKSKAQQLDFWVTQLSR